MSIKRPLIYTATGIGAAALISLSVPLCCSKAKTVKDEISSAMDENKLAEREAAMRVIGSKDGYDKWKEIMKCVEVRRACYNDLIGSNESFQHDIFKESCAKLDKPFTSDSRDIWKCNDLIEDGFIGISLTSYISYRNCIKRSTDCLSRVQKD